jgi:hypothetical protein
MKKLLISLILLTVGMTAYGFQTFYDPILGRPRVMDYPNQANITADYWVDGGRTDTYTPDGTVARPFLTIKAALDAINTALVATPGGSYRVRVAAGTYSQNLTITGPRYLRIEGAGVVISGTILINSGVGSYDRIEFVGTSLGRSEKGPAMTLSNAITLTRSNDSLIYVGFSGCYISGATATNTDGTWVLQYENCRVTGTITGTFSAAGHPSILLEAFDFNEFVGAITGKVSFYNVNGADIYANINTTPYYENRFTHTSFAGTVSIIPQVGADSTNIYVDAISRYILNSRTPTLTGATIVDLDKQVDLQAATPGTAQTGNLNISGTGIFGGFLSTGKNGADGQISIYSEQGETDYILSFAPHATMTQSTAYIMPANDGSASQFLQTDGSGNLTWADGGGGYTNLTSFVDQTAWRIFYSDGSGDVKELALGASGYLMSNGATSAPSWETPAGAGDMTQSVYDPDSDNAVNTVYAQNADTSAGFIRFYEDTDDGTNYVQIQGVALAGNYTLTLPVDDGTDGQYLKTNGSGVLSWDTPAVTYSRSFVITNPTASSDLPLWRAPANITITAIHLLCKGNVVVGQLWEYDANGLNGATVDASDITGVADTNVDDDGSLSNPGIASGNYLGWKTTSVTGTPTHAIVSFEFTKD